VSGSGELTQAGFHFAFQDGFAQACMETLLSEAHSDRNQDISYVTAITRALLLHLLRAFHSDTRREDAEKTAGKISGIPLEPILSFIDSRLSTPLTLNCLADQAGVSRAHFARFFREATGVSPHRYVTLRRVEKAKQLLKLSRCSLADIAQDTGFSNQSHFSQVFSAVTGVTPSRYRQEGLSS
jgi:AraC family transcriptional regulator